MQTHVLPPSSTMSAPSSSAPRGTGSISSQPVTASVIKFRCLYTHDLRRKSKRWQDGYLRYHAFNKRIMVYDEQGNYIGDHHWRSGEDVQDGDELELDKGALIQVGERMGTTQQDLSNLFEKRKSSQGSPQANDRASQTPGISTPVQPSGSSQPFRSLNDLLGIKKTPIGHLVSPYEERHPPPPPSASESPNRPPKRQKVPLAERSSVDRRQAPAQVVDLTESAKLPSVTNARNIASARETQRLPKDFHSSPHAPPKNKQIEVSKTTQPSSDPAPFVKPTLPPSASSKRPPDSAPHTHARGSQKQGVETNGRPNNTVPPPSRPSSRKPSAEVPTGTLRMSTEKPRRKLMYSALLPNETSQKSSPTPTMPPPDKRSQSTPRAVDQSVRTRDRY